jgi:hypothetical protein
MRKLQARLHTHVRQRASRSERKGSDVRRLKQSPLTDSNRRPPLYHQILVAAERSLWQRFSLVSPVSAQDHLRWVSVGFDRSAPQLLHTGAPLCLQFGERGGRKPVRSDERALAHLSVRTMQNGNSARARWREGGRPRGFRVRSARCSGASLRILDPAIWGSSVSERYGAVHAPQNSSPPSAVADYDESSARRDHQASAAVIAVSAAWMPSSMSPAVAAQCRGIRARAPGSHRCSSRVNGSGAVLS